MTPSVNIVVKTGWILERLARELVERIPGVAMNITGWPPAAPSSTAINYYMPEKDIRHMPGAVSGITIGLFTHDRERMRAFYQRFDSCVAMNRSVGAFLQELGARNVHVIRPGTPAPDRPIRFGVVGRVYGKRRKGAHLVAQAVRDGFWFQACSEVLPGRGSPPCRVTHKIEERSRFYRDIDYLVVTSTEEGGPMTVPEAIAHGVPVIAPDVGWCWEFPVIRYERGSWDSLREVLVGLTEPPSWGEWAAAHRELFARLHATKPLHERRRREAGG